MADLIAATDAIIARLMTDWIALTPAITGGSPPAVVDEATEQDMKPHPRVTSAPWARVTVRHSTGRAAALGNDLHRRTGNVFVEVRVPFSDGSAYTLCQRLAAVAQKAYEKRADAGVSFTSSALQERGREGTWYRIDVQAAFRWDELS